MLLQVLQNKFPETLLPVPTHDQSNGENHLKAEEPTTHLAEPVESTKILVDDTRLTGQAHWPVFCWWNSGHYPRLADQTS